MPGFIFSTLLFCVSTVVLKIHTQYLQRMCYLSFLQKLNSHSHVRNRQVEIHIFIQNSRKNKINEVRVTAENWRTNVNSKRRSHARTRSYSRLYCMMYIDLRNTFREQWIALLQALLKMHVEIHAVSKSVNFRHWSYIKSQPYFSTPMH